MRQHHHSNAPRFITSTLIAALATTLTLAAGGCGAPDPDSAGTAGVTQGAATYSWPKWSVLPILFVPRDWSTTSAEVQAEASAITTAMQDIQSYYRTKLGGRTFTLNAVQVVQGNGNKEAYGISWNGRDIYADGVVFTGNMEGLVVAELYARGYPTPPSQNEDGYSAVMFVKGAGCYAGGREYGAADGGWAIVGDCAIDSIQGTLTDGQYPWGSGRTKQTGAVAHEMGHTFALADADPTTAPTTLMGYWWEYPTIGFTTAEKNTMLGTKVNFFPVAELSPTAITYPTSIAAGQQVTFDSGVRNAGNASTGSFAVKWFVDGVQVGYGGHAGVAAGATVYDGNSAFTWTAAAGTHTITFTVDADNAVLESNEGNNSTSVTVTVNSLADLQPTTITRSLTTIYVGNQVTFDSGVRNAGGTGTGSFAVKWFVDNVQVGYGGHTGVAANTTVLNGNSAFTWTATAGTHTIRFTVDTDGHVAESNESNNSTTLTVTVYTIADLIPTTITYGTLTRGVTSLFDSGVRNAGTASTGTFNVKWYVDGVQVGYGAHTGIAAGTTVYSGNSALYWKAVAGTHTIRFTVDVDGYVAESSESNNSTSVTVYVP